MKYKVTFTLDGENDGLMENLPIHILGLTYDEFIGMLMSRKPNYVPSDTDFIKDVFNERLNRMSQFGADSIEVETIHT